MASKTPLDPRNSLDLLAGNGKSVIDSTWGNVEAQAADTDTPAKNAVSLGMGNQHVPTRIEQSGWCPKYLRYNIWDPDGNLPTSTTEWTETALPLPRPPLDELSDQTTIDTITRNPDLFKVVSPIKVDVFERLLDDHPNQPFVHSVCDGLRFGFWPWAKTLRPDYPKELDLSRSVRLDPARLEFLSEQLDHEQHEGRYSASFGSRLLPGMYCMPIFVVLKPHSDKFQLVNDHSASKQSLNGMIDHNSVVGYPMDNLAQFGDMLAALRLDNPDLLGPQALSVWKSDIAEAYRLCPVHPVWQLKQAAQIDGQYYID